MARAAIEPPSPDTVALSGSLGRLNLSGRSLLDGILACQRLMSWTDAIAQELTAAFARPGVAVPVEQLLDAARWSNAKPNQPCTPDSTIDALLDSDAATAAAYPRCGPTIAHHAARFAAMEVGAALHLSPLSAQVRVEHALTLTDEMPATLAAQRRGDSDPLRTRILVEATTVLSPAIRTVVEQAVLPSAASLTPSRLRAAITRTIVRLDPDGARDRAARARANRTVYSRPEADDMAVVSALLPADQAGRMMWLLNTMADAVAGSHDPRGLGVRRADALSAIVDDLITTGVADVRPLIGRADADTSGNCNGPAVPDPADVGSGEPRCDRYRASSSGSGRSRVCLTVHADLTTLAGLDDHPAELARHGVITADLARAIAASADSIRTAVLRGDRDGCAHDGCTGERTDNEYESEKIRQRVTRSMAARAAAGLVHGPCPYGYRRQYELTESGKRVLVAQVPDPATAPVVRELFDRLAAGHALKAIARDFEARGVRNRAGRPFTPEHLRTVALNYAYAGIRAHSTNGVKYYHAGAEVETTPGTWEPIVPPSLFRQVQAILADPARRTSRPGRANNPYSMIARCDVCGGALTVRYTRDPAGEYWCRDRSHVRVGKAELEACLDGLVCDYLAHPDVYAELRRAAQPDDRLESVRAELAAARAELAELRRAVGAGRLSVASLVGAEPGLLARVAELEARERSMATPPALAGLITPGKDVRRRWRDAPMSTRREVARILLAPPYLGVARVMPAPTPRHRGPVGERVVLDRGES